MPILGAHMSIAGGYHKAVEAAAAAGCDCVQVFTKNNSQWRGKPISAGEARQFRTTLAELSIVHPLSHDSYLINLASPDRGLWRKSLRAFVIELKRAAALGIPWVVAHPGAYTTSDASSGIARVTQALEEALDATKDLPVGCLLETTAGQGTTLGWRFDELGEILRGVGNEIRMGACVDTCHVFAAGYPLAPRRNYLATIRELDRRVGLERVRAFHLNDSKAALGSRVDRHEHIGAGKLGLEAFKNLLTDRRFKSTPMYLETPKGTRDGVDLDVLNLTTLRSMADRA